MPETEKNIAEVIPAVKLPRDLAQFFSYKIPDHLRDEIRVGDAVRIPFRREEILGVVKAFAAEIPSGFKVKEIKCLVPELSFSEKQIKMAEYIAEYYYAPLSLIIRLMLAPEIKKQSRKEIELYADYEMPGMEKSLQEKVMRELSGANRMLLIHSLDIERHELYRNIIEKQGKTSQTLLMLPEYFDIYGCARFYIDALGKDKVAILCSDITKNQYAEEWKKVQSGQANVIISTRQGVLAPLRNLKLVIVDEEHNSSYKQWDQNPRYHGVEASIRLAAIHDARILLASPTPTLETFYKTQKDFRVCDISEKPKIAPMILDFDTERKNDNYSFVFEKLKAELFQKIYDKKQALIFVPRLGEKTMHQCRDCGHIAECPVCKNSLIGYRGKLYCSRCKQIHETMSQCPKCQGQKIGSFGGGSQRVFEEIEALFEGKNIKVVELDSSTSMDSKRNQKIYADFQKGKIDVLLGTQMVWKNWHMQRLELIAIVFPEIIFNSPGFKSRERSWQFLSKVYTFAQSKTVIIETHKPEHKNFTQMREKTTIEFLREELENRSLSLSPVPYPPFGKMIKLIYKNADASVCEKEAKWQHTILQKEIWDQGLKDSCEVMPPFPAQNYREYGKYRWHLILKHKTELSVSARDRILACVKKVWILDVDPDEIL